jgi:predicted nucleic acid-binding protein
VSLVVRAIQYRSNIALNIKIENKEKMRIYLDNCAFNRPFDDQSRIRVRLESEAKLYVQEKIEKKEIELVWSYILDIENDQNPFEEKRRAIEKWKSLAIVDVEETANLIEKANSFVTYGVRAKDALHVSSAIEGKADYFVTSAIEGKADYFVTTDDKLLKKLSAVDEIQAVNPLDIIGVIDEYND